ncbi:hypothetical protein ABZ725_48990 [Streptomyces sp. NPDC006872]|uniref:hypothetical protein n=1 Tax=Streptomyces sp. NPDC006872 TaxID=3155720 RepID=UPI0033CB8A9B
MAAWFGAVAVLGLGACGTQVAGEGDDGVPSASASEPLPWTTMQPSTVTGVRLGEDGRTLLIDMQVPSGACACVRELKAALTDPVKNTVRVQITFASPSGDRASGCTKETPATAKVTLPAPLGDQDVIVDNYTHFTRDGAKPPALRLCGELGCTPPATGCTPASYEQALKAVGAPQHTYRDSEKCAGEWLVMDFSWRTGPACGDTTDPACTSRLGDRWYFRATKEGWEPILEGSAGGCRQVQRREPDFPTELCESLAPLPSSLHPNYPPASAPGAQ